MESDAIIIRFQSARYSKTSSDPNPTMFELLIMYFLRAVHEKEGYVVRLSWFFGTSDASQANTNSHSRLATGEHQGAYESLRPCRSKVCLTHFSMVPMLHHLLKSDHFQAMYHMHTRKAKILCGLFRQLSFQLNKEHGAHAFKLDFPGWLAHTHNHDLS
jgi:hypothetical protein